MMFLGTKLSTYFPHWSGEFSTKSKCLKIKCLGGAIFSIGRRVTNRQRESSKESRKPKRFE